MLKCYDTILTFIQNIACWRSDFNVSDPKAEDWDKGDIIPAPERFPDGMLNLTNRVHAMGFKLGLYTSAGIHTCNPGLRPVCQIVYVCVIFFEAK